MTFSVFAPPAGGEPGFSVVAGRDHGLRALMVAAGRLPGDDFGPVHVHEGDEVLRVVSGQVLVRCGDERRVCSAGELVVIPPLVPHGFRVLAETVLDVVAEYDIGTLYPVRAGDGEGLKWVEVHRADMPWGRPPPAGSSWTSDEQLQEILARLALTLD